jgi:hypothetical protein
MSKQNAMNALALIDQVNPGVGGYSDQNLTAVAQTKAWLRQIANGQLVVAPSAKPEKPQGTKPEKPSEGQPQ